MKEHTRANARNNKKRRRRGQREGKIEEKRHKVTMHRKANFQGASGSKRETGKQRDTNKLS